jgi:hypothetical protein
MPQPTTAEVRLDEHKAASFGPAGRASCRFGFQRVGCDRISLPRNPQGRKIATNNFGIREMSVQYPRSTGDCAKQIQTQIATAPVKTSAGPSAADRPIPWPARGRTPSRRCHEVSSRANCHIIRALAGAMLLPSASNLMIKHGSSPLSQVAEYYL